MEIAERIKLIALFDGWELKFLPTEIQWLEKDGKEVFFRLYDGSISLHLSRDLPYFSSQEWIMPVCKKFLNLERSELHHYQRQVRVAILRFNVAEVAKVLAIGIERYNSIKLSKQQTT